MHLVFKHPPGTRLRCDIYNISKGNMTDLCVAAALPLQNAVAAEREERVAEDDEIVAAVNDYTRALQDGLRILANS
jgi:hypothetical protein